MNSSFRPLELQGEPSSEAEQLLQRLTTRCVELEASDIHLCAGLAPCLRSNGVIVVQEDEGILEDSLLESLGQRLSEGMNIATYNQTGSLDGAITVECGARFRFNLYRRQGSLSIALRRLEDQLHSLADLGLSDQLYDVCDFSHGLIVVAGPTGSGKSTTLAAFLNRINETRPCHIITIEDPIEYLHPPRRALVNQRQIGTDASSFNDALVSAMRQDPDVILVGEIRDLATIRTAITAAETGHLVFTTVHAGSCVGTIERLVSVFPADEQPGIRQQLALILRVIIAQQLVVADGPKVEKVDENGILSRRRVVASEVLRTTDAIANLIATAKSSQVVSAMEAGGGRGMQTMEHDLARLWVEGYLTEQSASRLARNAKIMLERAEKIRRGGMLNSAASGRFASHGKRGGGR
ncbi:Type IV pilus twitching motility protein PilT [Planctomycetales bacterium 10988]|nr:Type IV pilus twitching motility protein PilT [Planctomycetales bacterium 10988]